MRLKLNRAAALTLTGTAILATLSQVGGAAPRSYIKENKEQNEVRADDLKAESMSAKLYQHVFSQKDFDEAHELKKTNEETISQSGQIDADIHGTAKIKAADIRQNNLIKIGSFDVDGNVQPNVNTYNSTTIDIKDNSNNTVGNLVTKINGTNLTYYLKVTTNQQYSDLVTVNYSVALGISVTYSLPEFGKHPNTSYIDIATPDNQYRFNLIDIPTPQMQEYSHQYHFLGSLSPWGTIVDKLSNPGVQGEAQDISTLNSPKQKYGNITSVFEISGIGYPNDYNKLFVKGKDNTYYVVDENGHLINDPVDVYNGTWPKKHMADHLSASELLKQTPSGYVGFSQQGDHDWLVAFNLRPEDIKDSPDAIKNRLESYSIYIAKHPQYKDKIINNTLQYIKNVTDGMPIYTALGVDLMLNDPSMKNDLVVLGHTLLQNPVQTAVSYYKSSSGSGQGSLLINSAYQFIDDETGQNVGAATIKSGKNGDHGDLSLTIPTGYKLAKNQTLPTTYNILDHNTLTLIHLVHSTQKKNNSSGVGTRRITYIGAPKNPDPVTQTVHFSRTDTVDDATDKVISSSDWQPTDHNGQWDAVNTPMIAGYKPDKAIVPADKASVGTTEVQVTYSKADQHAKLTVHDDTANTDLNDYTENSTGLYQDQINFKTAPSAVEQELKDKGYNIVSDSFKDSPTYNADDSKNNFVIHVTHKIVPVTPDHPKTPTEVIPDTKQHYPTGVDTNDLNKDVQRSIFYKYEDNTQAEPTVVQKAHFDRTVKVDAVTQKIVDNGTWTTKDNYPEVATKSIDGYTPDNTKVDSATPSMTDNQDQTVVYHANDEDAAITYIDDTTGKVLKTDTQKAKYKQTIKFATDPNTQIQTYKDQGYVLVSSDWKDGSTYQTDPIKNKFTVHLKHGTSTVTPDKPKKPTDIIPGTNRHYPTGVDTNDLNQSQQRQITYTYADSKKQASPTVTQKATFHRTATIDNVTGKTTYTDWTTSDQYPEVKSPAIEGYTPDKSNVSVTKPVLNTKQDVAVTYNPNPEQVDVIAQDNTGKQLSKSTLHGNYNTDYTATTPVVKGYHLIKMPANTHGTYKTHNDPIIYIYAPDSNSVPEQTDGTPKPDKSSYPNDLTPAKRSNKLPETGSTTLASELKSDFINLTHLF